MNEAEWLASTDPEKMLAFLGKRASGRKLRLFEAACCWAIWPLLDRHESEWAIEMATLDADGKVNAETLHRAARGALDAWFDTQQNTESDCLIAPLLASKAAYLVLASPEERLRLRSTPRETAAEALAWAEVDRLRRPIFGGYHEVDHTPQKTETLDRGMAAARERQARELRDLFGNPFRPALLILDWLSWSGGIIPNLAQSIYDQDAYGELPVLADALQEAGCDNPDILAHCRSRGAHIRGCWVVDLLLSKTAEKWP